MKDWILYITNRIMPPDTPRIIRQFAKWTFIFFAFFGLLMSFKPNYPVQMIGMLLMFLFLALVTSVSVVLCFRLLMVMTRKTNMIKLDAMYKESGFSPDMGFICRHSNPFGYGRERLYASYLYMMCEEYNIAREQLAETEDSQLSERLYVLKQLCKIRIAAMTGSLDRAEKTFTAVRAMMDEIYAVHPLLTDKYRPYLDDALTYYMIAAVLAERLGEPAAVEQYRTLTQSRLSEMESRTEAGLYEAVFELNLLFTQGRMEEADAYAKQLSGQISTASALPQGRQDDLLRAVGQARIYANIASMTAAGIDVTRDRPLPEGTQENIPPISAEHGETPEDMASIPFL